MQELLVDFITSLDGCGAAEGWPGWWGLEGPRVSRLARPAAREVIMTHVSTTTAAVDTR